MPRPAQAEPARRFLTILTSADGAPQVKRHTTSGTVDAAHGYLFNTATAEFSDLHGLAQIIFQINHAQSIIHAQRNETPSPYPNGAVRCLLHPVTSGSKPSPAFLEDRANAWLCLDLDDSPIPHGTSWDDPVHMARVGWAYLCAANPCLQGVGCVYNFSGSAGVAGKEHLLKIHYYVLTSKELLAHDRKRVLSSIQGVDPSLAAPNQRHYEGGRIFDAPLVDPLAGRTLCGVIEGCEMRVEQTDPTIARDSLPVVMSAETTPDGAHELRKICDRIKATPKGKRHHTVRNSARLVGGWVGAGFVALHDAQNALIEAVQGYGDPAHHEGTIVDFLDKGIYQPVRIETLADQFPDGPPVCEAGNHLTFKELCDTAMAFPNQVDAGFAFQVIQLTETERAEVLNAAADGKCKTKLVRLMRSLKFTPRGLEFFNHNFYRVRDFGGHSVVMHNNGKTVYRHNDFHEAYVEMTTVTGVDAQGNEKLSPLTSVWLASPHCQKFDRQEFQPAREAIFTDADGQLVRNTWAGHAVQPLAGQWKAIEQYLWFAIAGGDQSVYNYVVAYLSQLINEPNVLPKIALTLYSPEEGVGKGVFYQLVRALVGARYAMATSNVEHIAGDYNGSIEGKLVVFLDEVGAVKDKVVQARIRSLITEPQQTVVDKYVKAREIDNYARVISSTNDPHAVWLSPKDRRNVVLRVMGFRTPDGQLVPQDVWHAHVPSMMAELGAFMHYLTHEYRVTLATMPPIPETSERIRQRSKSLVASNRAVFEMLLEGELPDGAVANAGDGSIHFDAGAVKNLARDNRVNLKQTEFGRMFGQEPKAGRDGLVVRKVVRVPLDLQHARALFAQYVDMTFDWSEGAGSWDVSNMLHSIQGGRV